MSRVTAVFANHAQADAAIAELRRRGVADSHLSIVAKRVDDIEVNKLPEATAGLLAGQPTVGGLGRRRDPRGRVGRCGRWNRASSSGWARRAPAK